MIQISSEMRALIEGAANGLCISSRDRYFVEIEKRLRMVPAPLTLGDVRSVVADVLKYWPSAEKISSRASDDEYGHDITRRL